MTGRSAPGKNATGTILVFGVLLLSLLLHVSFGARMVPFTAAIDALMQFDRTNFDHVIIRNLRLPRAILAILVGASLSVAGAIMQGVTRNPLADPGILGLLSGAAFAVVVSVAAFPGAAASWLPLFAGLGALCTALLVWGIASRVAGGSTPLSLVLSGAAITAFLSALVAGIQLLDHDKFDELRIWLTGTIHGPRISQLYWVWPWMSLGFLAAFFVSGKLTALAMGDVVATGLGVNVGRVKFVALAAVVALTASAVVLSGPMGFVGLVVPHAVRLFAGADYRRILPYSAIVGAAYLLIVDTIARVALQPVEISTGLVTALFGAPLFVWMVKVRL